MALLAPISHGFLEDDGGAPGLFMDEAGVVVLRSTQGGPLVPIGGGGGGANAFSWTSKTLSSADLLALDTTPVEILPAPGGRNYHVVLNWVLHYRFGTVPYTGEFLPILGYGADRALIQLDEDAMIEQLETYGQVASVPMDHKSLLTLSEDAYIVGPHVPSQALWTTWLATIIEDMPVSIVNESGLMSLADGDGTLTVRLYYATIDGAP